MRMIAIGRNILFSITCLICFGICDSGSTLGSIIIGLQYLLRLDPPPVIHVSFGRYHLRTTFPLPIHHGRFRNCRHDSFSILVSIHSGGGRYRSTRSLEPAAATVVFGIGSVVFVLSIGMLLLLIATPRIVGHSAIAEESAKEASEGIQHSGGSHCAESAEGIIVDIHHRSIIGGVVLLLLFDYGNFLDRQDIHLRGPVRGE
mmetsp:Transcript_23696/g.45139  ORF Transcript_23696/g.45139 Transcript_23696/m.45139 type:complete len:202 (-) Transcript_23696:679-1284(-)